MSRNLYDLLGLLSSVAFILALKGLSHPKSARRGNLIGAAGAGVATFVVFFYREDGKGLQNLPLIIGALIVITGALISQGRLNRLIIFK